MQLLRVLYVKHVEFKCDEIWNQITGETLKQNKMFLSE